MCSRCACGRKVGGQNDFLHYAIADPLYKTVELQCPRTNAFKRRQASHQYIVQAAIAMAGPDHVLIGRGFNDTKTGWVTLGVGTRGAPVFFCKTITPGPEAPPLCPRRPGTAERKSE